MDRFSKEDRKPVGSVFMQRNLEGFRMWLKDAGMGGMEELRDFQVPHLGTARADVCSFKSPWMQDTEPSWN